MFYKLLFIMPTCVCSLLKRSSTHVSHCTSVPNIHFSDWRKLISMSYYDLGEGQYTAIITTTTTTTTTGEGINEKHIGPVNFINFNLIVTRVMVHLVFETIFMRTLFKRGEGKKKWMLCSLVKMLAIVDVSSPEWIKTSL